MESKKKAEINYSDMSDMELERIGNLVTLAMSRNQDALKELEDLAGYKFTSLGDLWRIGVNAQDAMTPQGRQSMWNRDAQRAAYTPPVLPDAGKTVSKVAKLRRERKMTQQQLAFACGVNIRQIQKYEGGVYATANMTLKLAAAIANALDVKAEDLL